MYKDYIVGKDRQTDTEHDILNKKTKVFFTKKQKYPYFLQKLTAVGLGTQIVL